MTKSPSTTVFRGLCKARNIPFEVHDSVLPCDQSTLFISAGMQRFKETFSDVSIKLRTQATVQRCLRLVDLELVGDGTHSLVFNMLGLFSFRHWAVDQTVRFFYEFMKELGLTPSFATVHPHRERWGLFHPPNVEVRLDAGCQWTCGSVGGYCTEFYIDDPKLGSVEVGNIVNPMGTGIDVGFGVERLDRLVLGTPQKSREEELRLACETLLQAGIMPAATAQSYVLRKLMRIMSREGFALDSPVFVAETEKMARGLERYKKLKDKHQDKPAAWWMDTHGIDLTLT